jgi:hypothetical protein
MDIDRFPLWEQTASLRMRIAIVVPFSQLVECIVNEDVVSGFLFTKLTTTELLGIHGVIPFLGERQIQIYLRNKPRPLLAHASGYDCLLRGVLQLPPALIRKPIQDRLPVFGSLPLMKYAILLQCLQIKNHPVETNLDAVLGHTLPR